MKVPRKFKLHKIVAKDGQRPALQHICFTGRHLVATDGFAAAFVEVTETKNDKPAIIPTSLYKYAVSGNRHIQKKDAHIVVKKNEVKTWIKKTVNGMSIVHGEKPVEAQYPQRIKDIYRQAIRKSKKPLFMITLNAKKLKDLADAMGTEYVTLCFGQHDFEKIDDSLICNNQITVLPDHTDAIGVIMPIVTHWVSSK
ncbi:MAG: hypothetical protein GXO75_15365 [Calditrichaeota bacterium]|nr:hypothetical protein [Calditrichota bacterium]